MEITVKARIAIEVSLMAFIASALIACGTTSETASLSRPSPSTSASSSAQQYVSIIRSYWTNYEAARARFDTFCYYGPINPRECGIRAQAILAVDQQFLSQLLAATPPPQFAADNQALLHQLPKVIDAVKGMITAAASGSHDATFNATLTYINSMVPVVVEALDDIDPGVAHT